MHAARVCTFRGWLVGVIYLSGIQVAGLCLFETVFSLKLLFCMNHSELELVIMAADDMVR